MADSFGAAPVGGAHQIGRLVRGYLDRAIERVHCFGLVAGCRFDAAGNHICMRIFWICGNKRFGFPDRLVDPALSSKNEGSIGVQLENTWANLDRRSVVGERVVSFSGA
jgi:hypothetical protein